MSKTIDINNLKCDLCNVDAIRIMERSSERIKTREMGEGRVVTFLYQCPHCKLISTKTFFVWGGVEVEKDEYKEWLKNTIMNCNWRV